MPDDEENPRPLTEAERYEMARQRAEIKLRDAGRKPTTREILKLADQLFAADNKRLGITSSSA